MLTGGILYVGVSSLINYNPPLLTSDILVCFSQVDVQSKEAIQIKTQIKTQFHNVSFSVIKTVSYADPMSITLCFLISVKI